jgi:hypothetical protein
VQLYEKGSFTTKYYCWIALVWLRGYTSGMYLDNMLHFKAYSGEFLPSVFVMVMIWMTILAWMTIQASIVICYLSFEELSLSLSLSFHYHCHYQFHGSDYNTRKVYHLLSQRVWHYNIRNRGPST